MGSSEKRLTFTLFRGAPRGGDATIGTSSSKDGNKGGFMGVMFANRYTRIKLDLESRRPLYAGIYGRAVFPRRESSGCWVGNFWWSSKVKSSGRLPSTIVD